MTYRGGMQPLTREERERVLAWLVSHPRASIDEIARSGLYAPRRAVHPHRAAVNWARSHVYALRASKKVAVVDGSGARGDPLRFAVTGGQL